LEALEWGGLLHDIGKIGVPDSVLLKQERLTRDERTTMNAHPVLGAEIIAPVQRLAPELPIIRHHHEWFNGSGYPDRLVADEIPRLARILHVADAFEAMTAARPYRMTPLTPEQALAELRKFGGIQFDPDVVDAFVKTDWTRGVPDPGRPEVRDVPMIGQVAGTLPHRQRIECLVRPSRDARARRLPERVCPRAAPGDGGDRPARCWAAPAIPATGREPRLLGNVAGTGHQLAWGQGSPDRACCPDRARHRRLAACAWPGIRGNDDPHLAGRAGRGSAG
jgi:hypothetical protein